MVVLAGSPVLDEVRQAPYSVVVKESVGAATELSEQGGCLDCMGDVEERTAIAAVAVVAAVADAADARSLPDELVHVDVPRSPAE